MPLPAVTVLVPIAAPESSGGRYVPFGIAAGREDEAATELLQLVGGGFEVSLHSGSDKGGEGTTSIRHVRGGYQIKVGGHGWQGQWVAASEAEVRSTVIGLASLNRGSDWQHRGSVSRPA